MTRQGTGRETLRVGEGVVIAIVYYVFVLIPKSNVILVVILIVLILFK